MGNVRTAIYNYIYAKQHHGDFIFRVEDTDRERSTKEYETELISNLQWLGLNWDNEKILRQSERGEIYRHYLEKIIKDGFAYISKEDTGGDTTKRKEVIRFKNPNKKLSFIDLIRGEITFDTAELGDFVIARSLTEPVYHLAVVIDDFEANVTHIIRGEDHISNTPRQILIQEAIGAPRPVYAHLPLILAGDRTKLSKRKHGEKISLKYFKDQGYFPEAIINYMAMLGWNPGTEEEFFTIPDLIKRFDIASVQKAGAVYSEEKLRWVNREYLKRKPHQEVAARIRDFIEKSTAFQKNSWKISDELLIKLIPALIDRIDVYSDATVLFDAGDFDYLFEVPSYDSKDLLWRDESDSERTREFLREIIGILEAAPESSFSESEGIRALVWNYATEHGRGAVLWPIRFALTGKNKSPDPFTLISLLGARDSIKRLTYALKALEE